MLASGDVPAFLIDGFPLNQDNLDGWKREMDSITNVRSVLNLVAPIEVCTRRCLSRAQNRSDDNEETLKKRFEMFKKITQPIVDYFHKEGILYQIDTDGTLKEVYLVLRMKLINLLWVFDRIKPIFIKNGFKELQ